jgi:UDP-N-acetylmuramoyl-tripeptide--D-alanyl-D-alanine ligase
MWSNGIPDGMVRGLTQDTRQLRPGDLYVALRGERFDGHDFVEEAFRKGAIGALVQEDFAWTANPVLRVPDTLRGLHDLARGYRRKWLGFPVGITGSVGKTTVKEMCADVLSSIGETHRTQGNFNNHIGLPLSMLAMPQTARFGVFELGMNHAGEIGELAYLLQPKVAVLTDICNAHRESFGSLEEIAREKAKLAERVLPSGMVFLDRDSEWYGLIRRHTCARVVSLSFGGIADYVGRRVGASVMNVDGFDYIMPLPGEHIMRNALRAIALGQELGATQEQVADALRRYKPAPMRWQEIDVNQVHFINDAYNANPLSMQAGLRTLSNLEGPGKKWAVLGGMRELGAIEEEEHAVLGRFIDELDLDGVITVGERAKMIVCTQMDCFFQCADAAGAAQILSNHLNAGDRVLLKASRGDQLEKVMDCFREI